MFEIDDGQQWSHPAYVTVTIEPVNDNSPFIVVTPADDPFVEGSRVGVQLLRDVTVNDADHPEAFNLTGAHVSICCNVICVCKYNVCVSACVGTLLYSCS